MNELVGKVVWLCPSMQGEMGYAGKILKISDGIIKIRPANKNHKDMFVPVASVAWMVKQ